MEMVLPYKSLLSLQSVYLAVYLTYTVSRKRGGRGCAGASAKTSFTFRKMKFSGQLFYSQYRGTDSSKEQVKTITFWSQVTGMRIYLCFQSLGSLQ